MVKNGLCNFDKYVLQFGQIYFEMFAYIYEMHCRRRITDGQKVSVFCVCGGALSLVGRNNKSAGKGSTNIQRSGNNTNTKGNTNGNSNGNSNRNTNGNTNGNENGNENRHTNGSSTEMYQQPKYNDLKMQIQMEMQIQVQTEVHQ